MKTIENKQSIDNSLPCRTVHVKSVAQDKIDKKTRHTYAQAILAHAQVIGEIDSLLAKQALHLRHEEAATLRRFKQKLADVSGVGCSLHNGMLFGVHNLG